MFSVDTVDGSVNDLRHYTENELVFLETVGVTLYGTESEAVIEAARYRSDEAPVPVLVIGSEINLF